jgi:ABC-2 type transport system permease protein
MNIFLTVLVMLPAGIAYAIKMQPDIRFYGAFMITLLFIPLVPIIISTLIGTGITIVSARFKHKNIIGTILGLLFFVAAMSFSFNANKFVKNFTNIAQTMIVKANAIYPLTKLYTEAVCDYNVLSLFAFLGISALLFLTYVYIVAIKYKKINTDITTHRTNSNYKMQKLKQSSVFMSLYKKELGRYLSSTLYVMNTAVGVVMLFLGIFFLIFSPDVKQLLETAEIKNMINPLSPLAVSTFMVMTCTTACSISIEGKNLWILKSAPINTRTLFAAKIAVNLVILIPSALVAAVVLNRVLDTSFVESVLLYITPIVYALFTSLLGLLVNLLFPKLDWTAEVAVIKQSMAVFVTMLSGVLSIFVPGIIIYALSAFVDMSLLVGIATLFIAIITIMIYNYLNAKGIELFNKL